MHQNSQVSNMLSENQPNANIVWQKPQPPMVDCPPGLENFGGLEKVIVQQQINLSNVIGYGGKNRYLVRNAKGEQLFLAAENSAVLSGYDSSRGFVIDLFDAANNSVLRVIREDKCCVGCALCIKCCKGCAHEIKIESPVGQTLGYIRQANNGCNSQLVVTDPQGQEIYYIKPPFAFNATGQVDFKVKTADNHTDTASISKVFSGYLQEFYTNADNFVVTFPASLSPKIKACLVVSTFLVDFMYFEGRPQYRRRPY